MMDLSTWHDTGDRFQWRGQEVFYQEAGEGDVIFLLHGFLNSSWIFKYLWPTLSEHYRVIAPDYIGCGYSSKPKEYEYSMHERADMIYALADLLSIKKCHIMATSYSVSVSQELLYRQLHDSPGLSIASVVFLNGVLFSDKSILGFRQRVLLTPIIGRIYAKLAGEGSFKGTFRRRVGKYSQFPEDLLEDLMQLFKREQGLELLYTMNQYVLERTAEQKRLVSALERTDVPIQLIWGIDEGDQVAGIRLVNAYREIKGDHYVVMLKDVGHFPMVEQPDLVLQYYLSFLQGITKKIKVDLAQ